MFTLDMHYYGGYIRLNKRLSDKNTIKWSMSEFVTHVRVDCCE